MPWSTPTLKTVRKWTRDYVTAQLNAVAIVPNSVLRVMSDAMSGLTHLTLLYLDWLAKQLMPDTAETEWLDRHGVIWLKNSDGSKGRKGATFAGGSFLATGVAGTVVGSGALIRGSNGFNYQSTALVTLGTIPASIPCNCLTAGADGNLEDGDIATFAPALVNVDNKTTVDFMDGGTDEEDDDDLRSRVLERIQKPPMGGDADDYVQWAKAVPGVTRAWSYPMELGVGTMTVRFMMDDLRSAGNGIPFDGDVTTVGDYIDSVRPVTVKDLYVEKPILYLYSITINALSNDTPATRNAIEAAIRSMEARRFYPGVSVYRSWVDEAVSSAIGEDHHELIFATIVMAGNGYLPRLDTITYT